MPTISIVKRNLKMTYPIDKNKQEWNWKFWISIKLLLKSTKLWYYTPLIWRNLKNIKYIFQIKEQERSGNAATKRHCIHSNEHVDIKYTIYLKTLYYSKKKRKIFNFENSCALIRINFRRLISFNLWTKWKSEDYFDEILAPSFSREMHAGKWCYWTLNEVV